MVVVEPLELGGFHEDEVAAQLAVDVIGGLGSAVAVIEAFAGVFLAGVQGAAQSVGDDVGDGFEFGYLLQAAHSGVGEAETCVGFFAFGVVGFEGDAGAAYDRGQCEALDDQGHDHHGAGEDED